MAQPDANYASAPGTNENNHSPQGIHITQNHRRALPKQSRNCQTLGVSPAKPGGFPLD